MQCRTLTTIAALAAFTWPSVAEDNPPKTYVDAFEAAVAAPSDPTAGAGLMALLPKVTTSFGPPRELFVIEGDLTVDADDLERYRLAKSVGGISADKQNPELIVHVEDGQQAHWKSGKQTLRYAVVKSTFPDPESYQAVVDDMKNAGGDWVGACAGCAVAFEYRPQFDALGTWDEFQALADTDDLRFIVVFNPDASGPIASAFFPTDTWQERLVSIFPKYFTLAPGGYTGRGVLRHELGHVLGYRHEHTRNIAGCVFEDANWAPVTPYDPHSVMHYFCGDAGTRELDLSELDRTGHAANYAPETPAAVE